MVPRYVLHILIVDDDALHGSSVRDLLAVHNYPAEIVTSGKKGLSTLCDAHENGHPYEVLILDLNIPDLSGLEVLAGVQRAGLNCKTIILSGENELSSVAPILKLGALDYLRKPFEPEQLINSVANAVARYQLEQEVVSMHEQAKESARLYEFLLNASPDMIYMLDEKGRLKFVNHQLEGVFGGSEELIGSDWRALFSDPELAARLGSQVAERRTGPRATIGEEFELTSDLGTTHALELSAVGLYEDTQVLGNHFVGTYGVIRDVTEAKRTRRELQQNQQKFYSLFVDSPDAVFIASLESGNIIERNPPFVALRTQIGGKDDGTDSFLWTEDQPRSGFVDELNANPDHIEWQIEQVVHNGQDEEIHYFEIRARRLELEGSPCMIATLRDRTTERQAELDRLALQRQLQQAGRMEAIGQVAGGIAHDFNNILASIIGYTELVMNARNRLEAAQIDQYLEEVVTAGHRARDLISQMLTFTRAQRQNETAIAVNETLADVSRMLRAAIPSTIELNLELAEDLPPVAIDAVQLQQIVINLLINARDAIKANGRIDVDASVQRENATCETCGEPLEGEHVVISVTDTGHGILPEFISKIFEMYFTTREADQGTGFGLWMVNNLVHDHHGHLTVDSEVGTGTTFKIYLPVEAAPEPVPRAIDVTAPQIDGRILVVDDEVSVANFIGEVLRDRGYPTVVFTDSPQAMDYLKDNLDRVSLLLTDGAMPLISGVELAEYAKSQLPELPIIFITAYTQSTTALKQLGVNKFLKKPFSIEEMMTAVAELTHPQTTALPSE